MDAYQQQQPHRYMIPPPPLLSSQSPPPADPHLQYHPQYHHQPPPPPPPPRAGAPPPQGSWYSNQFQYQQHHNQSHSTPSPPPPPPQQLPSQWGPPPHSDHSAYPPAPPLPYPPHPHNISNHFAPPPPPRRPYLPPAQIPNSFSHVSQEWSNPNRSHHQVPAHNNVEDWGAKAREWANTRAAMQDQPVQSQIAPAGRPEEQNRFHDPYYQAVGTHYMDGQQSLPTSIYQQFPVPAASPHRPPTTYPNETLSNSSGPSSYIPDGRLPCHARDGTSALDPNSGFLHQESLPTSSSVHQQEVPSSYSSVSGKENPANQTDQSYKPLPLPISSAQEAAYHMQAPLPDIGRSVMNEQSFMYGSQTADHAADISDRPLDFAPRFSNDHDPQMQSNYVAHHESMGTVRGIDLIAAASSINSWTPPVAPGAVYPPVLPPGPQHDSLSVPSSVTGHTAPSFPKFPGPSFQAPIPSSSAPFGLGTGAQLHPVAAFPGDMYGTISERPKKGPVPNWLKEEILRNKATIAKSSLEHPREETQPIEDEAVDKSLAKSDQADSKSIDSSRSTEEEDDDEDYVEAARTAAINQEIKRVLTEVLLKVTDELFDEIATKIVNEDDSTVEVDHNIVASNHKVSRSSSPVPTPKASARILVPGKAKEPNTAGVGEKSSSSSPGNVLGLANYASEDEDDEIQSSRMPDSGSNAAVAQSSIKNLLQNNDVSENGNSQVVLDEHVGVEKNFGSDMRSKNNSDTTTDNSADRNHEKSFSSKVVSGDEINYNSGKLQDGNNGSGMKDTLGEPVIKKSDSELPDKDTGKKSTKSESQGRETRVKSDKNDRHESRKSSFGKDPGSGGQLEVRRSRESEKGDENHLREDERLRKQNKEDRNGSKERVKEYKTGGKTKESDSRKRSNHLDAKDDKKDTERSHRASAKEDVDRKRERTKEEDRSRHKRGSDSSRHKRRRSSSIGGRGRNSKDNSGGHANDSSDEALDGSKRKLHIRKQHLSPSPVRSRRRGRRSRLRSPVRRWR
ncbi:hypothetical protein CRYUN_Cryun21dG0062500 [Craigia yunnanensis]